MTRFERAGDAFARLCEIMAQLRGPGGCPWDREQTLRSLEPYLIEEAYETLEAMERGDFLSLREELGDLLLQIVFQAEITNEDGHFDAAEVVEGIAEKLVRRHPHVFGAESARDASGALRNWEAIKAAERPEKRGRLAGVPKNMPALLRALRTGEKAAAMGLDWPNLDGVREKVEEEWKELGECIENAQDNEAVAEELGDLLFTMANLARHLGLDAEAALRRATDKFSERFRAVEKLAAEKGLEPSKMALDELERLWQDAKASLRQSDTPA